MSRAQKHTRVAAASQFSSGEISGEAAGEGSNNFGNAELRGIFASDNVEEFPMFSSDVYEPAGSDDWHRLSEIHEERLEELMGSFAGSVEDDAEFDSRSNHRIVLPLEGGQLQSGPQCRDFSDVDIDACIQAAALSLPFAVPKPIWDDGIWSAIMGDGILMKLDEFVPEFSRPGVVPSLESWLGGMESTGVALKRKIIDTECSSYSDVVKHIPDRAWQEERESLLQSALKRWLVTLIAFDRSSKIWRQLASEEDDVRKLSMLGDIFNGKAPSTLLKRVRAVEKMVDFFGIGCFPASESENYRFFCAERAASAPPSRLKSYVEALAFCMYVFSMDELRDSVQSKRLHGATVASMPTGVLQASPLLVSELTKLHEVLHARSDWTAMFSGSVLFAVYSRARWSDAMHANKLMLDADEHDVTQYIEAETAIHKSMHAEIYRHRYLPLVAPALGVTSEPWVDRWMQVRRALNIRLPPEHPLMPAPAGDGSPLQRALTATEAGDWLRKILPGSKAQFENRRVTAHSMKSTCLSFCAKYGLTAEVRLQLGYHVAGFKMLHTYSRDAAAQPLLELERVLSAVRTGQFKPDVTRSGRFTTESPVASGGAVTVVNLEEPKEERCDVTSEVIASSSSSSSEEEFQTKNVKLFKPPVPPEGYVFWQHKRLRTLHLTRPECHRVLMCNRMIGAQHIREGMVIRYDTPVCRQCASATKV